MIEKKKGCSEAGWATTHFQALVMIQQDCIVTQGLEGSTERSRRAGACNSAPRYNRARVRASWLISQYNFFIAKGKAALCRDTA